jgi:hypothetical protein
MGIGFSTENQKLHHGAAYAGHTIQPVYLKETHHGPSSYAQSDRRLAG